MENSLNIKPLPLFKGDNLISALKREGLKNIPSNVVLDKTLPGVGATYTEIHAKRNSIIIEPNVPVIKGKVAKHSELNLLGVYKGVTSEMVKRYLLNSTIKYKKILTTPEGFKKIKKAASNTAINIYTDFFCLFDECEKLSQDVGYRKKITNPVTDFFAFENKAFVSATPFKIHHPKVYEQNFTWLKVEPQFDYKKDIDLILTNDFANTLSDKLIELKGSKCVCIFYNSTDGINSVINSFKMQGQCKVFCSDKSKKKLEKLGFTNIESDYCEPLEKYNLFTSRFFSAIDIELNVQPDIIILSNLNQAEYTMIDPLTEAIQIQGRFRKIFADCKNYNSLTHITNFKGDLKVKSEQQLDKEIEQYKATHGKIFTDYMGENNPIKKAALKKDLKRLSFNELLNRDEDIDDFAVHNLYNEERVKSYYTNLESLHEAYKESKFFNVTYKTRLPFFSEEVKLKIRGKESMKNKLIRIVSILKKLPNIEEIRQLLIQESFEEANTIVDAYKKLGEDFIIQVDFSLAKIKKDLEKHEIEEKRFDPRILQVIKDTFELGNMQDRNFYKQELQKIYSRFGIKYKVVQITIKDYYNISLDNGLKPATYRLDRFKFDDAISLI
jgi:hypothetical protein